MTPIQERNKLKRVSYDTWSTREQLCLASSVLKSGDQNWIGVSRSLKPFTEKEALRPPDWFSQKSCAMQYAVLLENADTPKRKKRESSESTGESIVRRLTQERIAELGQILAFQRDEYQQLKAEVNLLRSGIITEEKLQKMWLAIEQEERDQEQKARAHAAWLAKRQQKQEVQSQSLQTVTIASQRKMLEYTASDVQEAQIENEEEERKNRGGRSPLLTSLLKSPSPTTQMQTPTTATTQPASSPTIASLLGSSPKVPTAHISTSMPPQLHQIVTSAMTNAATERPSVGAPTLSMLLELPANLQRGSLASLQKAASNVQQQIAKPDTHTPSHLIKPIISQINESTRPAKVAPIVPSTENMVQIIDQVDDVIRKDIMSDVINKDEINEIIGDLEELIKEEIIVNSPRQTPPIGVTTAPVEPLIVNPPTLQDETVIISERLEPRDVDEAVSLSNSPQSEIAIEEIDQSTSSIAEIIGTVAIDPVEPKVIFPVFAKEPANRVEEKRELSEPRDADKMEENIMQEAKIEENPSAVETDITEGTKKEGIADESSVRDDPTEEAKVDEKPEQKIDAAVISDLEVASPIPHAEIPSEKEDDREHKVLIADETCEITGTDVETVRNLVDEPEESTRIAKETNDPELDDIKVNLEKFTGDRNEVGSADAVSVCSEVTTDIPSIEDNEKSQDIGAILEEEKSFQSGPSEKKDTDDQSAIANLNDLSDWQESFRETSIAKDPHMEPINEHSTDMESLTPKTIQPWIPEEDIDCEKMKVVDPKNSEDGTSSSPLDVEKKEKLEEAAVIADVEEEYVEIDKTESNKEEQHEKIEDEDAEEKEEEEDDEEEEEEGGGEEEEGDEEEEEVEEEEEEGDEEEEEDDEAKPETAEKEDKEENIGKEAVMHAEFSKDMVIEEIEGNKCAPPTENKPDVKDESDTENLIKQLEEPKTEEMEIKEEKEADEKPSDSDVFVKKHTVESASSICDDITDLDEEESSLSKLSGGRAMKTYSKKQTIAVDSEPESESSGENGDYRAWKKAVMLVYNRLATHKYASVFLRPITEDHAPGYHSVIFRPMDLSTIKKNIDNGTIRSTMHFQRDVMLMFQNAIMYNKQDTFVYKMAVSMQEECLQHMQILVQVTGEGQLRRETRTAASSSSETGDPSIKRKRSHITPSPHDTESPRGKKRRKSENE